MKPATERRQRERKQEIVDVAARIFHEKGYGSSTIQDIAEGVGILKGSLYYYIDSKEDLLYEILEGLHREEFERVKAAVSAETETFAKLRSFMVALFTFHAENLTRISVFFSEFRSLPPDRQRAIIRERDRYDRLLRSIIREGQAEGIVCPDLDSKFTALAILGMINWIYQWYRPGGGHSASSIADMYADIAIAGVACSADVHEPGHRRHLGGRNVQARGRGASGRRANG